MRLGRIRIRDPLLRGLDCWATAASPHPRGQVGGGEEPGHVEAGLGDDRHREPYTDTGDLRECARCVQAMRPSLRLSLESRVCDDARAGLRALVS